MYRISRPHNYDTTAVYYRTCLKIFAKKSCCSRTASNHSGLHAAVIVMSTVTQVLADRTAKLLCDSDIATLISLRTTEHCLWGMRQFCTNTIGRLLTVGFPAS